MLNLISYFRRKRSKHRLKKAIERDRAETARKQASEKEMRHGFIE